MLEKTYTLSLHGTLGNAGKMVMENYLKAADFVPLVEIFHRRNETDNGWRCEFWGKILRGAILLNHHLRDPQMAQIIDDTVADMIATQKSDGSITSYPAEKQLQGWNLWGIKYVLLALLRYAQTGREPEKIPQVCTSLLAYVEKLMADDGHFFPDYGQHTGLAASSMLGAIVKVWDLTGDARWKKLAEKVILSGCSTKHNIFDAAANGTLPADIGNGKAYELTSCFQGLAEYLITAAKRGEPALQDKDYKEICFKYFQLICDHELMVTGAAGLKDSVGEYWFNGKTRQHLADAGALGETCVMTTLLHYADAVISLAGEEHFAAAEMAETILYNALYGGMTPDGSNFTHANPTPLTGGGWKAPAPDQMLRCFKTPFHGHDCCRAQGPEGLAMAYPLALRPLADAGGIYGCVVNLYEKMHGEFPGAAIEITGDYPYGEKVEINVKSEKSFLLSLRIPHYTTGVLLNGRAIPFTAGEFLKLDHLRAEKNKVEIFFDLSIREVPAPGDPGWVAFKRGALILAADSRKHAVPGAKCRESRQGVELVEYAAAGNGFSRENCLQVFFRKE